MPSVPRPVMWTEGMLMSPQHLQQQDLYHEVQYAMRAQKLTPDAWGLSRLVLDGAALASQDVVIHAADITFPSGLMASWDASAGDVPLTRRIGNHPRPDQARLEVYLAVARLREGIANVALTGAPAAHQRYIARQRVVAELTSAATPAVEIHFTAPHVQLLFADELTPDVEAICVAELNRDASGAFGWSVDYIAPCLHIGASAILMASIRRVLEVVVAQQRHLTALCKHRRRAVHALQVTELLQFTHLSAVRAALPLLEELVQSPHTAPRAAYLSLRQAMGHLSALSAADELPRLPPFDLADLRRTFTGLFAALDSLLEGDGARGHTSLPLTPAADGTHTCTFDSRLIQASKAWYLTVLSEAPVEQTGARWSKLAKVASPGELPQLVLAAATGVPLTPVPRPPASVPWQPTVAYFALDTTHRAWQRAVEEGALAVAAPPGSFGIAGLQLALLAVRHDDL